MRKGKVFVLGQDGTEDTSKFSVEQIQAFGQSLLGLEVEDGNITLTTEDVRSPGVIGVGQAEKGTDFTPGKNDDNSIVVQEASAEAAAKVGVEADFAGIGSIVFGANVDTEKEVKALVKGFEPEIANTIVNVWNEFNNGSTTPESISFAIDNDNENLAAILGA